MISPKLHTVLWRDAHGMKDEDTKEDILKVHKPALYWSAGILVESDEEGVTLAQDYGLPLSEGGEITYRTRTFIPRVLIDEEFDAGQVIRKKKKPKVVVEVVEEKAREPT